MKYKDTVKRALTLHSTIYKSRLDVDEHLFAVIGNGYSWVDGELVTDYMPRTSKLDSALKCLKRYIDFAAVDTELALRLIEKDKEQLSGDEVVEFTNDMLKKIYDRFKEECGYIKSVNTSYGKYEHISQKFERGDWKIYPICGYSKLVDFPDNIKPDWAEAMYKFVNWCLDHPECIDDCCSFDKQIEYLKNSKKRLEKINK